MFKDNKHRLLLRIVTAVALLSLIAGSSFTESYAASSSARYQFGSNYYTQPDNVTWKSQHEVIPSGFIKVGQSSLLDLYVSPSTLAVIVRNRQTGYLWTSIPSKEELKQENLDSLWSAAVHSPLVVNYFDAYANSNMGSFQSLGGKVLSFHKIAGGFASNLSMSALAATLRLVVKLDGNSLVVQIPGNSIHESGSNKLASIQMYPFLGAVHNADIQGYMFIPDGSGALIRYSNTVNQYEEPFTRQIYGQDVAITDGNQSNVNSENMSVPVFGVVNGINHNGFLAVVENGKYDADIVANPSGVTTNLNWVTAQFIMRYPYFQPTSLNMGGYNTFEKKRINGTMQVRYIFLSGNNANYVGMAKAYRGYLLNKGDLHKLNHTNANVPIEIDMLGEEMTPGLLWNGVVPMTTFSQAQKMISALKKAGVHHIEAVLRGWSAGGLTGQNPVMFPVAAALGGAQQLLALKQELQKEHVPLYLYANFTDAFRDGAGYQKINNAVRSVTDQLVQRQAVPSIEDQTDQFSNLFSYYMNPLIASKIATNDAQVLKTMGIRSIAVDRTGYKLFSDFNPSYKISRQQAASTYQQMAKTLINKLGSLSYYTPNEYLWKYTRQIFQIPMSSSQYMYETDTVPFLQIVLHGYVNYFATFTNFNANPQQQLLKMIDYGAYPSFYLTYEPAYKLLNTPSRNIYTSKYADWRSQIQKDYRKVNMALRNVQNATLQYRSVVTWGVVEDGYSNGVRIIVNYGNTPVKIGGVTVRADSFAVLGRVQK